MRRNGPTGQRGYVVFLMALSMVVICGFTGLVVDAGFGEYTRIQAQAAADAGAKAAALELAAGATTSVITAAVLQDTANNGFTNGHNNVTVTVNNPPASGNYASNSNYVEVIVSKTVPTTFMAVMGSTSTKITARSVGGKGSGGGCVYLTTPTSSSALNVSGNGTLNAGCGIMINSSSSTAIDISGNAVVKASVIDELGGYSITGNSVVTPTPKTGVAASADPLAYVAAPTVGSCNYTNYNKVVAATMNPGVYCGGINISGGAAITLNPGTYIVVGGGINVSGNATFIGTGVTFYLTYNSTYGYQPVNFSGGSQTSISAPTSGALAGILFFQDRTSTNTNSNSISGSTGAAFTGAMYFINSPLNYSGGSSSAGGAYTIIVATSLTISGNSYLGSDYSALSGGSPIKSGAILAE